MREMPTAPEVPSWVIERRTLTAHPVAPEAPLPNETAPAGMPAVTAVQVEQVVEPKAVETAAAPVATTEAPVQTPAARPAPRPPVAVIPAPAYRPWGGVPYGGGWGGPSYGGWNNSWSPWGNGWGGNNWWPWSNGWGGNNWGGNNWGGNNWGGNNWWPWGGSGWGNDGWNSGYGSGNGWGNTWGDGSGDAAGDVDFDFTMRGRINADMRGEGYGDGYGSGRGYGYGYQGYQPYPYPPYGMMPQAYPAEPEQPVGPPDGDNDGVSDAGDLCPDSAEGVAVDALGCSDAARIVLRGVNFETDSAKLTDESLAILDGVSATLSANPQIRVMVSGHTDSDGDDAYNKDLSQRRAQSVVDYLVSQGVDRNNMIAKGYGEEQPIAGNDDADGKAVNRRVELNRL